MRAILLTACFLLAACNCQPPAPDLDAGTDGGRDAGPPADAGDAFDAWREIRDTVRQSPDAVPARARALVAAKDAPGLFALVRDDIALLPTTPIGFDSSETAVRWGTRGTLRGQAGTPRERAELLKQLLVEAGFTAEVVAGVPDGGATGLLARAPNRALAWDAGTAQVDRWGAVVGEQKIPPKGLPAVLDPMDTVRNEIVAQLKPLITAPVPAAFDPAMTRVPLVKATVGGKVVFLNPNVDGAQFDQARTVDTPEPALAAAGEHTLKVTLSAARSAKPGTQFPLVERTWNASDVAGRTVTAAFTAPLTRAEASQVKVGDVSNFIPMLVVRGEGLDPAGTQALSALGKPVTREGAVIETAAGGIVVDGNLIPKGPTPMATLTSVATLTASATAVAFPEVEVRVIAKQAGGARVTSLAADAFIVKEGADRVAATIERTGAGAPKVVLLFDRSDSIPDEFRLGAATVGHNVADALFTAHPGAQIQVVAVDVNGPTVAGPAATTLADVDTALAALTGTGSELWTALDVVCSDPSLSAVVLITDAVVDDAPTPAILSKLVAGPPVLVAAVGTANQTAAARFAELTHGAVLTGVTPANLPASVTAFIGERVGEYRIVYRAPATGPTPRQVTVSLKSPGTAMAAATYTPPATPVEIAGLSALYLTVETDGHSVTRLLAGSAKGTAADREAVAGALWGKYVLGVEANPPSFSTLVEEHLDELLAYQTGVRALWSKDAAALKKAADTSIFRVPSELKFFATALPDEANPKDVTFAAGLTVTLHRQTPTLGVKVRNEIDMLPLVPRRTVVFDGSTDGYLKTVERTALLAVTESVRFSKATRQALAGKTLAKYDPLTVENVLGAAWAGVAYPAYADYDVYAPVSGTPVAFWAVHKQTGEVIGVMENGGGDGSEDVASLVERLQAILDAVKRVCEAIGYEGVSVWADLESIKVAAVGNAIATFEGQPSRDPATQIQTDACNMAAGAVGGQIPGLRETLGAIGGYGSIIRIVHIGTGVELPRVPGPCG